jgi:hypothetical protein
VIAALSSCDSEPTPDVPEVSKNFSFERIEYEVRSYRGEMEESVKTNYPMMIYNNSSVEQPYIFNPRDNAYDRMTFSSGDSRAFKFTGDEQNVKVPTWISPDGTFQYDDGARWFYQRGDQQIRPELDSETILSIKPDHALVITSSFTYLAVPADYKLYLKGDEFGEEIVVEGSCANVMVVDYSLEYEMIPLE